MFKTTVKIVTEKAQKVKQMQPACDLLMKLYNTHYTRSIER